MKKKQVRIEIRYDIEEDKDMINFIDKNGSTRASFVKQVMNLYKNQIEAMTPNMITNEMTKKELDEPKSNKKRKLSPDNDISLSSKNI